MIDQREPTLEEILNEPIIQQMMLRDGVRADEIHRLMETARTRQDRRAHFHAPLTAAMMAKPRSRLFSSAPCA